jgi:Ca2+-binding RTX toxin-like protein
LSTSADVELLETATQSSTTAIDLTGSSIANTINGNDGANILDGKGGSDILSGYGGADTFQFTTALGAGNVDTVLGFVTGSDKITLDDAVFTQIGALGALSANAFFMGTTAHDADDRVIYNQATGALFYDADGSGGALAVQFAMLSSSPALAANDFIVI